MPASIASIPPKRTAWAFPSGRWPGALGARRRDVCLVTKVGVGYPDAPNRRDSSRARIMAVARAKPAQSRHRSCRCLSGALAGPEHAVRGDDARARRHRARRARHATSACRISGLSQLEACMKLRRIDVVQYGWNMFDRRMQREIFPWCTAQRRRRDGLWLARLWPADAARSTPTWSSTRPTGARSAARWAGSTCSAPCSAPIISRATCARSRS